MHTISPDDVVIIGGGPHQTSPSAATESSLRGVLVGGHFLDNAAAAALLRSIADELDPQP